MSDIFAGRKLRKIQTAPAMQAGVAEQFQDTGLVLPTRPELREANCELQVRWHTV